MFDYDLYNRPTPEPPNRINPLLWTMLGLVLVAHIVGWAIYWKTHS